MKHRGFSLVELLVAMAIGTGIAVLAFALTGDFQKFYHQHAAHLSNAQTLRRAAELIGQDLRNAGAGVGYRPDGRFGGLIRGGFEVAGGARFEANDRILQTVDGRLWVDDLGIRRAMGERRTVLYLEDGYGEICAGLSFRARERVSVTSKTGRRGRSLYILEHGPSSCTRGRCLGGCSRITWRPSPGYISHEGAASHRFAGGDLHRGYETVVWFIAVDAEGRGQLRRAASGDLESCARPDASCGVEVMDGVELLQYAVWSYDPASRLWSRQPPDGEVQGAQRLRVDLELVARGRTDPGVGRQPALQSQLREDLCVPAPCGRASDRVPREVLRTTIEVRNAGRMYVR